MSKALKNEFLNPRIPILGIYRKEIIMDTCKDFNMENSKNWK